MTSVHKPWTLVYTAAGRVMEEECEKELRTTLSLPGLPISSVLELPSSSTWGWHFKTSILCPVGRWCYLPYIATLANSVIAWELFAGVCMCVCWLCRVKCQVDIASNFCFIPSMLLMSLIQHTNLRVDQLRDMVPDVLFDTGTCVLLTTSTSS